MRKRKPLNSVVLFVFLLLLRVIKKKLNRIVLTLPVGDGYYKVIFTDHLYNLFVLQTHLINLRLWV